MAKSSVNLQDSFLNQVRKDNAEVKIILLSGHEMTGQVRGFDNFTVIFNDKSNQRLVYKHAIAQVITKKRPVRSGGGSGRRESEGAPQKKSRENFNRIDISNLDIKE